MKIFALLLFSLEFMAPAMLVNISVSEGRPDLTQLVNGGNHQNLLYSAFTEAFSENEEGRESQRDVVILSDFVFDSFFLRLMSAWPLPSRYASTSSEKFDTQPAIFKLNCTFLI